MRGSGLAIRATPALAAAAWMAMTWTMPAAAQLLDRLEGVATYDQCVAERMRGPVPDAVEQSIRMTCHDRFIRKQPRAEPPEHDFAYNPFVSWLADRDGSRGFAVPPGDPNAGQRFSHILSDARVNGLRRLQTLYRQASNRVVKVWAQVKGFNTLDIAVYNGNAFPISEVVVGISETERDACLGPVASYPDAILCPAVDQQIPPETEGHVTCKYVGDADLVTACVIGFKSGFVSVDDLLLATGLARR